MDNVFITNLHSLQITKKITDNQRNNALKFL